MPSVDVIRDDFLAAEYRALGRLYGGWFRGEIPQRDQLICRKNLPAFRCAVTATVGSGGPEIVPHELAQFEYAIVYGAIKQLKPTRRGVEHDDVYRKLVADDAVYRLADGTSVSLPYPVPRDMIEAVCTWLSTRPGMAPKEVALEVVAARFGPTEESNAKRASASTVGNYLKKPMRETTSLEHALLGSAFLDLAAEEASHREVKLRKEILECLFESTFPPYAFYYLVWLAHCLRKSRSCRLLRANEVRPLCERVRSIDAGSTKPTPLKISRK